MKSKIRGNLIPKHRKSTQSHCNSSITYVEDTFYTDGPQCNRDTTCALCKRGSEEVKDMY